MADVYFFGRAAKKIFQMIAYSLGCFRKILKFPKKSKF